MPARDLRLLLALLLTATTMAAPASAGTPPDSAADPVQVVKSKPCGDAVCHELRVTCGGIPAREVTVREFPPTGEAPAAGTVVFATGVYGVQPYDEYPPRAETLRAVRAAGFEAFEVRWGAGRKGWGDGADGAGFTAAMCGYTAVVRWLVAARADRKAPLCAQGNSGAALQIAYGLAVYGLGDLLDLAVLSGGPPISRVDRYCFEGRQLPRPERWRESGRQMIDHMLGWEGHGDHCKNGEASDAALELARRDSLVGSSAPRTYGYPRTRLIFLESEGDNATAQGELYYQAVTSEKSWTVLPGRSHGVDRTPASAARLREVLLSECRQR